VKKGFGLMEVLIAAVVLGFLVIGLNRLQLGNREGVLRVRSRDAANTIAQEVIEELSAKGATSIDYVKKEGTCPPPTPCKPEDLCLCRHRTFEGESGNVTVDYRVDVDVVEPKNSSSSAAMVVEEKTQYMIAAGTASKLSVKHQIAKQINVTVKWNFKNSSQSQSINVSALIK